MVESSRHTDQRTSVTIHRVTHVTCRLTAGSAPEPYARQSSMGCLYLYLKDDYANMMMMMMIMT